MEEEGSFSEEKAINVSPWILIYSAVCSFSSRIRKFHTDTAEHMKKLHRCWFAVNESSHYSEEEFIKGETEEENTAVWDTEHRKL